MTTTEILTAKIKCGLALAYLRDLAEWRNGDPSRFARMVDGRGKQVADAGDWLRNLASICSNPVVVGAYPDFPGQVVGQLEAIGLVLPTNQ